MRNDRIADGDDPGAVEQSPLADAPVIEGYTIERELGRGGEAIVYLAREHALDRRVALKVLRPERAASIHADRFVQEIALIARLTHTNILPLHSAGRSNGVLYYTGRYVEGESLRARIAREKQLSIPEAVRIAREVASALDFACRSGVVHRDIKPENILLGDGHAIVADFGIARAVDRASDHRLTAPGLGVGTVLYMSPEQGGGEADVDGRSDIYSLGCVLYEMLIGSPPFHGSSASNIIAHHMASPVPSLRDVRPTVSRALEDAIMRALAKTPADRYATAAEFAEALGVALARGPRPPDLVDALWRRVHAPRVAMGVAVVVVATAGAVWAWPEDHPNPAVNNADASFRDGMLAPASLRLAILAVDGSDTVAWRPASRLMRAAVNRWSDVTVEDDLAVLEALGKWRAPSRIEDARRVAERAGAGRFLRLGVHSVGDSLNVSAMLYEVDSGTLVSEATVRVARDLSDAEAAFQALANGVLTPDLSRHHRVERVTGTTSLRARTAYLAGHRAIEAWNLPLADSLFSAAVQRDPQYAHALFWLSQVRVWRGQQVARWRGEAMRANARRDQLDAADTLVSDALVAFAGGKLEAACELMRASTTINPTDFASWYGYANCLRRDDAVVRDSTQPTGWRFRSDYSIAVAAYQRAFELLPSVGAFNNLANLLKTHSTRVRYGQALPPDTLQFRGYPSVERDSIVFVAIPAAEFEAGRAGIRSERVNAAIERYRQMHRDIAVAWRSASPTSSDALEAVAMSLDLYGDPASLDTLRRARRLAMQPDDRLRLAALEAWVRVKISMPNHRAGLEKARDLADSLLKAHRADVALEPGLLGGLAALLGRAELAARYAHAAALQDEKQMPGSLNGSAMSLLAFASLGGPAESLATGERSLAAALARGGAAGAADARRMMLRAATVAFPEYRSPTLAAADTVGDYTAAMLADFLRDDTAAVRRRIDHIREQRRTLHPTDVTFDALYPEAALLAQIRDTAGAVAWLDPTLGAIAQVAVQSLTGADAARPGPLVRSAALRAELAHALDDSSTARRYAIAVAVLWAGADQFLQPTVRRMKVLAR